MEKTDKNKLFRKIPNWPKTGKIGQKWRFLYFFKDLVISKNNFVIDILPQTPYLEKFWLLIRMPKCFWPIRL